MTFNWLVRSMTPPYIIATITMEMAYIIESRPPLLSRSSMLATPDSLT